MKNFIIFLLTVIIVLTSFASCGAKKYEPYTSLIVDQSNSESILKLDNSYWTGLYFEKKNMKNKVCSFLETEYTVAYDKSITDYMNSFTTDIYYDDNRVAFGFRENTENLVFVNFMNYDFFETEPFLPDVNQPKEKAISISTEIANKYLDNIEEYTQIIGEPQIDYEEKDGIRYEITYYFITFAKKINGFYSSDYIDIKVTSKGHIASIKIGDIGAFDNKKINIDQSKIEKSIFNKINGAYEKSTYKVSSYNIEDQKICLTPDGNVCLYSSIDVDLINNNAESASYLGILTTLSEE